jgi:hypothetical protein
VPGLSVTLISTAAINGKIYFMDKKYYPGNTTGAYELDPSLVNNPNWTDAWRSESTRDFAFLTLPHLHIYAVILSSYECYR